MTTSPDDEPTDDMGEVEGDVVDSHMHLWDTTRFSFPWFAGDPRLDRPYLPQDYLDQVPDRATWSSWRRHAALSRPSPRSTSSRSRLLPPACRSGRSWRPYPLRTPQRARSTSPTSRSVRRCEGCVAVCSARHRT